MAAAAVDLAPVEGLLQRKKVTNATAVTYTNLALTFHQKAGLSASSSPALIDEKLNLE